MFLWGVTMQIIECEMCGSNRLIKTGGVYQCEHCGTKYTPEEAKKLIISGTVEVVKGNAEKERLLSNAKKHLALGHYHTASQLYSTLIDDYPDDPRAYFALPKIPLIEIISTGAFPKLYKVAYLIKNENLSSARRFDPNFTLNKEWDEVVKKHGEYLIIKDGKIIDFDLDLMCADALELNPSLLKLRNALSQDYCQRLYEGKIYVFGHSSFSKMFNYKYEKVENIKTEEKKYAKYGLFYDDYVEYLPYDNEILREVFLEGKKLADIINKSTEISVVNKKTFFISFLGEKHKFDRAVHFVYGNSVIASDYEGDLYPEAIKPNFVINKSNVETVLRSYNLRRISQQELNQIIIEIQNELDREKNKIRLVEYIDRSFKLHPLDNEKASISPLKYRYNYNQNRIDFDVFYDYRYGKRKEMGGVYYHGTPYDLLTCIKKFRYSMNSNICPFCNVPFKGVFSLRCPKCGKSK